MGCGGHRVKREETRVERGPGDQSLVPIVEDFHCGECGITSHKQPRDFRHICRPNGTPDYQRKRQAACGNCPRAAGDLCTAYKAIHPDRECSIKIGIKTPYAACPLGRWGRVSILCPRCNRAIFDESGPTSCRYCGWNVIAETPPQPSLDSICIAVTSLSLLPHHRQRQALCLDSWRNFGLSIIAVNRTDELSELRDAYSQVSRWIVNNTSADDYERPTQRINHLADVASETGKTVLVINSDIEIYGDQRAIVEPLKAGKQIAGIRWNYQHARHDLADRERWGIDAFSFTPEYARSMPRLNLAIGKPFWDYWIPTHSQSIGQEMHFVGERLFYHQWHPVHWSKADWDKGEKWCVDHYGVDYGEAGVKFRNQLPFPPDAETA